MKYSLKFIDPHLEQKFNLSKKPIYSQSFIFIVILLLLQVGEHAYFFLTTAESTQLTKALPFIIALPLVLAFLLLGGLRLPNFSAVAIALSILLFGLCTTEFSLHFSLHFPQRFHLILGANSLVLALLLVVSKISWLYSVIIIAASSSYTWLRINPHGLPEFAPFFFFSQALLVAIFSFFGERETRKKFFEEENINSQLKTYEDIMNLAIQSSIIFLKNDEVLFSNSIAKRTLEISAKGRTMETLKTIKIIRRGGLNEFIIDLTEKHKPMSNSHCFTLYDLYKDCESYFLEYNQSFPPDFNSVVGEINLANQEETATTFIIQIGPTFWQNEQGILLILNDISHIKRYYHTLDTQKDSLLATVSHDLRAPLNGIMGILHLLLEEISDESCLEKLNISIGSAKLMQHMINDILDFAMISKGKLRLKYESTNVSSLVEETIKVLSFQANSKGLSLVFENFISNPKENHIIDGNRVKQVLFNLIGNAIKFTKKGKVVIRVRDSRSELMDTVENSPNFEYQDEIKEDVAVNFNSLSLSESCCNSVLVNQKRNLEFEVEDTGVGIKKEDIGKLFQLFSRVTAGHDEKMSGIGLGLAISQSLVLMMNGQIKGAKIRAESVFGKGTVFRFPVHSENEPNEFFKEVLDEKYKLPIFFAKSLETKNTLVPISTNTENTNLPTEGDALISESKNNKIQVLVVDDDQLNLLVASKYLKSFSDLVSFQLAENGEQALNLICENSAKLLFFDVIFMDCNMPFMDGYEATAKLKAMMKERKIPWASIVGLTGNSLEEDLRKCTEAGMDSVLTKPYMKNELFAKIQEAVKKKEALAYH